MTQSAPSERAQTALETSGMSGSPLMSLERDDALFVLTDDMLVYQDGGGTRRVTLRDLTRIHSDQAGLLRVETPAGTALTASLLGFDVAQVQTFFKGVRSATARAKDVPSSSTPTLGGAKTFGSEPAARSDVAAPATTLPQPSKTENAGAQGAEAKSLAPIPSALSSAAPTPGQSSADQARSGGQAVQDTPSPSPTAGAAGSLTGATVKPKPPEARKPEGNAENPVVISSSSFSPNVGKPGLGAVGAGAGKTNLPPAHTGPPSPEAASPEAASAAPKTPLKPDLSKASDASKTAASRSEESRGKPPRSGVTAPAAARTEIPQRSTPDSPVAIPGAVPVRSSENTPMSQVRAINPSADADLVSAAPPTTALIRVAAATALARQAETVEALAGRLKVLGAVLFVAALALAFFQFTGDQALAGIWTLLSGGVGAIALLALGELSGLLSLLARSKND